MMTTTVLGIDPGLRLTGYGFVCLPPYALEPTLGEGGVIRLNGKHSLESRLAELHMELDALLTRLRPNQIAVEKLYAHYAHPRTAILMGHARGVILLVAQQHRIPVHHLAATAIKKAITGYGRASKEQMQRAVATTYGLAAPPSPPDVADAIGIATAHARRVAITQVGSRQAPAVEARVSAR